MTSGSPRCIELRCPDCGWRLTENPAAIAERLRRLGKIRARSEPDWEILLELLRASTAQIDCGACGRRGVLATAADESTTAWPDVVACEGCGKPIPSERLESLPGTTLCAACQGIEERGGDVGPVEYCPRCGSPMAPRLARDRGITRYILTCTAVPPCRPRQR